MLTFYCKWSKIKKTALVFFKEKIMKKVTKFIALFIVATMIISTFPMTVFAASSTEFQFISNRDGTCYVNTIVSYTNTNIIIPSVSPYGDTVTAIGTEAFLNCSQITSITIPNSVTDIGDGAFSGCSNLTNIIIPNSVTSIGSDAFYCCSALTSITIPKSVTSIGVDIFGACYRLESISVESGNTQYHSAGNCLIKTTSKTLIAGCKNSIIPCDGSVTRIDDFAFNACDKLTSITIPKSVTSIGMVAFFCCSLLDTIYYEGSIEEWNNIEKGNLWDDLVGAETPDHTYNIIYNTVIDTVPPETEESSTETASSLDDEKDWDDEDEDDWDDEDDEDDWGKVTKKPKDDSLKDEKTGGCGASIGIAGITLVATLGTCAAFVTKKKKD